jgi:peptide/nickel transport system substrate-binding protein
MSSGNRLARWLLCAVALGVTATTAFAPHQEGRTGGKLVYGLTLSPSGIDPHVNASSELGIPLTSVYDPLVWQVGEGQFVPGLARSWEISPDGLTYTFHLRDDVKFHDGTAFNADAVKANLDRIMAPETRSQKAAAMLGPYAGTEVVDDHTVRIVLKEPFAPLLDALSQVYVAMASPAALAEWGQDYQMHQVGTGPFKFKEYIPGDHLTLTANPDYNWAPDFFQHQGRAYVDEVEFRFFTEPAIRPVALEGGEAQVMGEIPPQYAPRLADDPDFAVMPIAIPGQSLQMFINTQRFPTDDLNVRRAILYASDRPTIVKTIFNGFSPAAWGPLSSGTLGFDESLVGTYAFDLSRAEQLLTDAGWVDQDGDGIREKDGQPLRLDGYLMTWGSLPEVGALLQAQLREAGIDLQNRTVAFPAALDAARQGQHHLIPFNLSSSDPDILRNFFYSGNAPEGFNWSKVADPELDRLLIEGARTLDNDQRAQIYGEIQQRIMDMGLIVPIREYVNINGRASQVKGLQFDVRGWFPLLYDVYLEP